ncbi:MAG: VanZ family protein [Gammaproteobacteria bacterium]
MNKLLFFIVLLIVYGSLYPFKFSGDMPGLQQTWQLLTDFNLQTTQADVLANIILFIPLGFVIRIASNQYRERIIATSIMFGLATVLAFTLQYLQLFLPSRVPDAGDATFNMLGTIIGIIFSHIVIQYSQNHIPADKTHRTSWSQVSIPLLLALLWICWRWFPFIPFAATDAIIDSLNPLITQPELDFFLILRDGIGWLIFYYLLSQPPFDRQPRLRVLKIAFAILGVELFIINNQITVNDLLAALGAFALYASLDYPAIQKSLTWGIIVAMLLSWLAPLSNPDQASSINWLPFAAYIQNNPWSGIEALFLKLYLIGTLIFIIKSLWFEYRMATFMSFLIVLILILLQVTIGTYKPDITDTLVVIFVGWAMYLIDKQASDERIMVMR